MATQAWKAGEVRKGSGKGQTVESQNRGVEELAGRRDSETFQGEEELMPLVFSFWSSTWVGGNLLQWVEARALQPDRHSMIFGHRGSVSGPTTGGICDYLQVTLNLPELLFPLCTWRYSHLLTVPCGSYSPGTE